MESPASQIARLEPIVGTWRITSPARPSVKPVVRSGPSAAICSAAGLQADNVPAVKQANSPLGPASVANANALVSKSPGPCEVGMLTVAACALPVAISYLLLWNPPHWSQGALLIYLFVVAVVVRTFISFYEIPSSALNPELTEKYDQRTALSSYRVFFAWKW